MESHSSTALAEIINSIIKGYINSIESNTHNQDSYKLEILKKEFQKVQQELDDGYRSLEEISIKYGTTINEEKNLSIYHESLNNLRETYNKLASDRIIAESKIKALEKKALSLKDMQFSGLVADWIDNGLGLATLITQISGRVQEIKDQLVGLAPDNPQSILLKRRQSEMEAHVERLRQWLIKNQTQTIRGKLTDENSLAIENARTDFQTALGAEQMLLKEMERAQQELLGYNTAVLRAETKRQEIKRLVETLTRINERIDQIQMEFSSPGRITVIAWAIKPESPSADPRKKLLPVCFILSLLTGIGVALARELTDSRIKRPADMEKMLGFPLTGVLLRADEEQIPTDDLHTLHCRHPRSFMVQQLSEITVKIDKERLDHGSKVFALTGLSDGCGVTMLAMNILAMSPVPKERRLFIDLNNRNPAGSREPLKSELMMARGSELLQGFMDGSDERFPFVFYPCPADQQERLVNSREDLQALLKEIRQSFDLIVLDLPPILLSADAQAIVSLADVTILVAMAHYSLWGQLMRSVTLLDNLNIQVVSVILNRVGFVRGGYLRKNLQAYYTLGGEKKQQLLGRLDLKVFLQTHLALGRATIQRLFGKD